MLGKNILSIIGLLFVGHTLASNTLPTCKDLSDSTGKLSRRSFDSANCNSDGETVSYCTDSNKIYEVTDLTTFSCKTSTLSEGVHVFIEKENKAISKVKLTNEGSNPVEDEYKGNLSMYLCNKDSDCEQTKGYIKVTFNGDEVKYYEIGSTSKEAEKGGNCDGKERIGLQSANHGVCLSVKDKSVEFGENDSYLLDGSVSTNSIFSIASGKDGIVLTRDLSTIYFNNIYTDEEYCKYQEKNIISRKAQFVEGTILNTLYECESGACKRSNTLDNVVDGTYLVDDTIYDCRNSNCKEQTNSGILAFKKDDGEDITYKTLLSSLALLTEDDLDSVYLYDCIDGECKSTSGFIKYGDTPALASCTKDGGCVSQENETCDKSNAGKVNLGSDGMKLCGSDGTLSSSVYNLIENTIYEANSDSPIIGAKQTGNFVFGNGLKVCTEGNCISVSKAGYFLNSNSVEIADGKKLIYCSGDLCEANKPNNGYYINDDYIKSKHAILCDNDGCLEIENLTKSDCNENVNELVYITDGFKYCDGTEAKNIPTETTVNLYEVDNVKDKAINYPTEFVEVSSGNKMVIKVDKYSVTQFVDDNQFCISSNIKVEGSCSKGDTKYTCINPFVKCETFIVGKCDLTKADENCDGYYVDSNKQLEKCNKGVCSVESKIGYFQNGETYIKCTTNGESKEIFTCSELALIDSCKDNNGALFKEEKDIKLCIDDNNSNAITIFKKDTTKCFIGANILNNKVNTKKHYIISTADNEVLTETIGAAYKKYKYIKSSGVPAILVKGEQNNIKADELIEFTVSEDKDNTYEKEQISSL